MDSTNLVETSREGSDHVNVATPIEVEGLSDLNMDNKTSIEDPDGECPSDVKMHTKRASEPSGEGSTSTSKKPAKRFELKKWNAIAMWAWDIKNDNCAICRNGIMELCIECQANQVNAASEECVLAWGVCKHAYHYHCITRWLKTRPSCPLDNNDWELQKYGK